MVQLITPIWLKKLRRDMPNKDFDFSEFLTDSKPEEKSKRGRATPKKEKKRSSAKKKENMDRFTSAMTPAIKEAIQAIAWYDRVSQREIVEEAIQKVFPIESERVKTAIKEYRKLNS